MNLAQLLNAAVLQSTSNLEQTVCRTESKALIKCLKKTAGFNQFESEHCILCTVEASMDENGVASTATVCDEFEADTGFCDKLNECFSEDCSDLCRDEYEVWSTCIFGDIGCPDMCQDFERLGVREIA